jgi:UDP-N-acetylglucosamine--N-acetylmuramyl-(pentapeptide) pyrophosphoryl-undecaprenol N-acetylglucosamine transferase
VSANAKTLLIAGGGTGGHVIPALAVAREWLRRQETSTNGLQGERRVVLVGTERGIETKLVPQAGLPLELIRAAGLKGIRGKKFFHNLALVPAGFWDSEQILRRHRFNVALGVGGYASGPIMLMAAAHGVPTVVYEPNVNPGLANRLVAKMATRVAVGYRETAQEFGRKAVVTGIPIRHEFFQIPHRVPKKFFNIFITGGSLGAHPINETVIEALNRLVVRKNQLFIVHQTGERDYNAVRAAYERHEFQAEVLPFIANMAERFAQADLIICRSGATTVAEVAAAGRAAIFIPFGAATDGHQTQNAVAMQTAGAAKLLPQNELNPARLTAEILALLDHPEKISLMEERAHALAKPTALEDIVDVLEAVARP